MTEKKASQNTEFTLEYKPYLYQNTRMKYTHHYNPVFPFLRLPFTPSSLLSLQMRSGRSRTRMQARAGPEPPVPELLPHHLLPERRPRCPEGGGVRRVHELDQRVLRQPDSDGLRRDSAGESGSRVRT